jgi:hypothetical protein
MEIILVIGQTKPDDILDSMKKHGLVFNHFFEKTLSIKHEVSIKKNVYRIVA